MTIKKFSILIVLLVIFLTPASGLFAQTAADGYVPLTTVPGAFTEGEKVRPGDVVGGIYQISIGIGAMLAVIMIVWGGMQYTLSEAVGNKERAKTNIKNAIFGLVLLLSSFIILRTINVDLTKINLSNFASSTLQLQFGALAPAEYVPGWYWRYMQDVVGPFNPTFTSNRFETFEECNNNINSLRNPSDDNEVIIQGKIYTVVEECKQAGTAPSISNSGTWYYTSRGPVATASSYVTTFFTGALARILPDGSTKIGMFNTEQECINHRNAFDDLLTDVTDCRQDTSGNHCFTKFLASTNGYRKDAYRYGTETICESSLASACNGQELEDYDYKLNTTYRFYCTDCVSCPGNFVEGTTFYTTGVDYCYYGYTIVDGVTVITPVYELRCGFASWALCETDRNRSGVASKRECAPKIIP